MTGHPLRRLLLFAGSAAGLLLLLALWAWNDRLPTDAIELPVPPAPAPLKETLRATWLGAATLLLDDGETQLLVDPFFSRPSIVDLLVNRSIDSDAATVNAALVRHHMDRLAAIIVTHSHFDHVLDVPAIANRSDAMIIGSASTARLARGSGVPEGQITVAIDETRRDFGRFTVTLRPSLHGPVGPAGGVPWAGAIPSPLALPARPSELRAGAVFDVLVEHPMGTLLIVPSAGFTPGSLLDVNADVVFLGIARLSAAGDDHVRRYWHETVTASGADRVIPIHFDDYTQGDGTTRLPPTLIDNVPRTIERLLHIRSQFDPDVTIYLPLAGQPMDLAPLAEPET